MQFYSLNKSILASKVFSGIKYEENALKAFIRSLASKVGITVPTKSKSDDEFLTIDKFSDGEFCPIFRRSIRDKHVAIMVDGHDSDNIIKTIMTIDAAKRSGAKKITVIIPYLPYSRQDKNDHVRSSIGAKAIAGMLEKAGATRIITIEMHSPAIQGFYDIPVIHLYGNRIFTEYAKSLNLVNVTVCPPDHGAIKRNADFAKAFPDSLHAVIDKKRKKPNEVASMEITGEENIPGRNVVSADDMGDTLGTLAKAADLVMSKGALSYRAFLTHPVMSGDSLVTLYNSKITELVVSDTIVSVYEKKMKYQRMIDSEVETLLMSEINPEFKVEVEWLNQRRLEISAEVTARRPKFTIISSSDLLSKSINSLINKKGSINDINNG